MGFTESIIFCSKNLFNFNGRASRSEFWWWHLFVISITVIYFVALDDLVRKSSADMYGLISVAVIVIIRFSLFSVTARRLHDLNKSGWIQVIAILIPLLLILIAAYGATAGSKEPNKFGYPPAV